MTITIWEFFIILGIGAISTLLISWIIKYRKLESTCVTCGKHHKSKATLKQCPKCKKWFCADNLEKIDEAYTSLQRIIDMIPPKKDPAYPCGTMYIKMGKTENILCKKDSKRFTFSIKLKFDK